jgi:cystathionine beta-lyase/cystathionine gamma-synthase
VVAVKDLYGGTRRLFDRVLSKLGIQFTYVEGAEPAQFEAAMKPETKMFWAESPSNPLLRIVDLRRTADVAHKHNSIFVVDNTFMSPYLQQPLKLGADIVVHSTAKYLGGHSDLIGGAVVVSDEELHQNIRFAQNAVGAVPGPLDCWLALRGTKTLAIRLEKHCSSAMRIANFLSTHEKVLQVFYPGLESHPNHQVGKSQMRAYGGMVSFYLKGNCESCKSLLRELKIFTLAESLGGVESLADHPASMTHASVPKEEREKVGITDSLIRLSVGIEDVEDLVSDLFCALEKV